MARRYGLCLVKTAGWKHAGGLTLMMGCIATVVACSTEQTQPIIVPVVGPTTTSAPAGAANAQSSSTTPPNSGGNLPTTCEAVSTSDEVADAIGRSVEGVPRSSVGQPDSKIGRTARLDCYYGLSDGEPVTDALVTISLASYTDAQAAEDRVEATVDGERDAGADQAAVKVGEDEGTLLTGKTVTLV